jgi:hypothetical protein
MHEETTGLPAGAGSGGVQKMPAKRRSETLEKKRQQLARKKADIIYGQNTQTKAAYDNIPHRVGVIGF